MNATLLAADCLPRGGSVKVVSSGDAAAPSFRIRASGSHARVLEEVEKAVRGEASSGATDARGVQPYLTYKLARALNAGLTLTPGEAVVDIAAG